MPQRATQPALDVVLDRTGDGAFATDTSGTIVAWNAAAEQILGYTLRETKGRACCQILGGYDVNGNRLCSAGCPIMALVKREEPVHAFDMRTRTNAGRPLWLNVSVLAGAPGGVTGPLTIHLMRDVTEAKETLKLVREHTAPATPVANGDPAGDLTRRELEILRLLADGLDTADAAQRLHVSRATIRNHVQNLFGKLGVHSRLEAVAYAARHRLF